MTTPAHDTAPDATTPSAAPRSRRALIRAAFAGAAGVALGALGGPKGPEQADAAAGGSFILGKANSAGTAGTSLATKATAVGLTVAQTGTGGGLKATSKAGAAGTFSSTAGHGVSSSAVTGTRFGVYATNTAAATSTGAAVRADGRQNAALIASTATNATPAVLVTNTYAGTGPSSGRGIRVLAGGATAADIDPEVIFGPGAGEFASSQNGIVASGSRGVVGVGIGSGKGVYGYSTSGTGVYGYSTSGYAVHADGNGQIGLFAYSNAKDAIKGVSDGANGVYGISNHFNATGVYGEATSTGYGLYSKGKAGVQGSLDVTGTLTKGGGTFRIDHPLDPAHKFLSHSFVESPDMKNVYDGVVELDANGEATVTLPDWFEALNRDVRYQLTAVGAAMPSLHVAREFKDGSFAIGGGLPGAKVSWMLTGIRKDAWAEANRTPVEEDKTGDEVGLYLHPKEHGQPEAKGLMHAFHERAAAQGPKTSKERPAKPQSPDAHG